MKARKISAAFGLCLAFASGARATELDYSQGYCVREGTELKRENAMIVVNGGRVNGLPLMPRGIHDFFDPNSEENLDAISWSENITLRKTGRIDGPSFFADFERYNYANPPITESYPVQCVAFSKIIG